MNVDNHQGRQKRPESFFSIVFILLMTSYIQAQTQSFKGWPDEESRKDLVNKFKNPPKGYGNVPFYWWNGDSLSRERLTYQLDLLQSSATDGFAISYAHTHPGVDVEENRAGFGGAGRTEPGKPEIFTGSWWEIINWFTGECARRGMGVGMDDYTFAWERNGYFTDSILHTEEFRTYQGRLEIEEYKVGPGETLSLTIPDNLVTIVSYPGGKELSAKIENRFLNWQAPSDSEYSLYIVSTTPAPDLHPMYGKEVVRHYFDDFYNRLDEQGKKGINYFFQDELEYHLDFNSWAEDLPHYFKEMKGCDILPYLPALKYNIGDITPKIRLDFAQVITRMSEERYFKPIFDWHNDKGLLYGCDNYGRGTNPLCYLDYFRMSGWFTAPGNDAPSLGSSFLQTKVSSSVSHLYDRPRTWLEAFHSMGWDSAGEWLYSQLDHHLVAGGNLLCLHGLYYSTHGGWWGWAPPCFHFRMPYWPHMKKWLEYAERLSYLLSQGEHVCDIGILYPTESMQAYPDANPTLCFAVADQLSKRGLDYDFLDCHSLQNGKTDQGILTIGKENYKIIILADIHAMHDESLGKILDFYRQGGIVLATGTLPKASSRIGEHDSGVEAILREIFGETRDPIHNEDLSVHSNSAGGKGGYGSAAEIVSAIPKLITPGFIPGNDGGRVLHRKIDNRDVYMVTEVKPGSDMFFRTTGKAERWNAEDGTIETLPVLQQTPEGTTIRFNEENNKSWLVVFSPGTPEYDPGISGMEVDPSVIPLTGSWQTEVVPTLDNRWGDYRLPATDELIGPEARLFLSHFRSGKKKNKTEPEIREIDAVSALYGYGPHVETITKEADVDISQYLREEKYEHDSWQPYTYSWQYGVYDHPGSQGYHGLKGKVDSRFFILDQGGHQLYRTKLYAEKAGTYRLVQEGIVPDLILINKEEVRQPVVRLDQGWHNLLIAYKNTPAASHGLSKMVNDSRDPRLRSMVVVYPEDAPAAKEVDPYASVVASKWFHTPHVPYDPRGGEQGCWYYTFETAPGTCAMELNLHGEMLQLWVDGKEIPQRTIKADQSSMGYLIPIPYTQGVSRVTMRLQPSAGYPGSSVFTKPVKLVCKEGAMQPGDWTQAGALAFYSGGMRYTKEVELEFSGGSRIILDLGTVSATCEVKVNGEEVGFMMRQPYRMDITDFVKQGINRIEVLVYSTLSNHYQEIPSPYRGKPFAGLIGPVHLELFE